VVSPDAGSEKRAGRVAKRFGLPVIYGYKVRDVTTGALSGFGVQEIPADLKDKPLLVVDDICDGGGTFLGLGEKLKEQGARADLYVTHGLFTKGTGVLSKVYDNIYTTDTVIADHAIVGVFPVCEDLLRP
jgi:ribose-phosphate pyrophosphokinase